MLPFEPLDKPRDPDAWVGGLRRKPTWRRRPGVLDRAGFHTLLRAAQLPLAELRHMGADEHYTSSRDGAWVEESGAIIILGRIVWDARWGVLGHSWNDDVEALRRKAEALGLATVREYFNG